MSRLLDSTNQTRDSLEARNLYTPNDPYDANASNAIETINSIVTIVNPFGSFDLENTIVGRLIGNNTPLAQIGLQMLARQFGATAASNAAAEYLPAISFSNLFDGDPDTKFVTVKKDFQITRRETQSNIGRILEEISGNYPLKGNPFTNSTTNIDYITNSGKGQLQLLVKSLNHNRYKPSTQLFQSTIRGEGFNYGDMQSATLKTYFLDWDNNINPYRQYKQSPYVNINSINEVLNTEVENFRKITESSDGYLEYGANQEFVDGLGKTSINNNNDGAGDYAFETNAEENNYGLDDNPRNNLTWGRDGINNDYRDVTKGFDDPLKGTVEPSQDGGTVPKTTRFDFASNEDAFTLEAGGLLSYTRELLNSKGKFSMFDGTKKKFIDTEEQLHFNGSPLTKRLNGDIDRNRQHSIVDPYNNYVKAIRFNGNKVYNGNENSVIYNSVIPQVVPTIGAVNKNLMFSIENLAMIVNGNSEENSTFAIVDDEFGTELPLCEKGPHNGRLMWFPPYDIQLSENVVVNRNTTNFIGRGEPIYTYSNTERMANLSFKLIIDYPPQVKGLNHVDASRFFAFGGEATDGTSNLGDKIKQREDLIKQRDEIKPTKQMADPQFSDYTGNFFFANDLPKSGSEAGTVDFHLFDIYYEVENLVDVGSSGVDGKNESLNVGWEDKIITAIIDLLVDDNIRPYIKIELFGSASKLFNAANGTEYNLELSKRRINGIKAYIEGKYKEITDRDLLQDVPSIFNEFPEGDLNAGDDTDEASEISSVPAKTARSVKIKFTHNGTQIEVEKDISEKERQDKEKLDADIAALDTEISKQKRGTNLSGCEFNPYTIEDGILKGFNSTENNKYKPAFHSQTPEDFHRRLTFLHQCTRQGEAVRKKRGNDNTFSANNAVFGRQPVQILRIGDFFNTKIFIDNMQIDYSEAPWDMNPEGMGMQFMMADVKLQLKLVGGQSLKGPINALQNAVSYNFYANSTFYNDGVYANATNMETLQQEENAGIVTKNPDQTETPTEDTTALNNTNLPNGTN